MNRGFGEGSGAAGVNIYEFGMAHKECLCLCFSLMNHCPALYAIEAFRLSPERTKRVSGSIP